MRIIKTQDSRHEMHRFKTKNTKWVFLIVHYYVTFKKQTSKN